MARICRFSAHCADPKGTIVPSSPVSEASLSNEQVLQSSGLLALKRISAEWVMKRWFLLILILELAAPGWAQLRVSPTSITTGLRWDNVAGGLYIYSGTTLTVSGNSGAVKPTPRGLTRLIQSTTNTRAVTVIGRQPRSGVFELDLPRAFASPAQERAHCPNYVANRVK